MSACDSSMLLPDGMTCDDCRHVSRCLRLGVTKRANTNCDFAPSRFLLDLVPEVTTPGLREAMQDLAAATAKDIWRGGGQ